MGLNLGVVRFSALVLVASCSSPAPSPDAQDQPWVAGPELPGPRLEPGVTAMGQRLVVLGGFDQNVSQGLRIANDVIVLDPVMSVWTTLHPAPVAWTHVNLAAASTTLYLLGGQETQQFIAKGETYALDTLAEPQHWRQLKAMPAGEERGAAGIIVAPPHIYLLGGASSTGALKTCLDYDITTDTWTMLPELPAPRSHPATMRMADGTLIVAGGLAALDAFSAATDVWALPIGALAWQPRAAMPTRRGGCAYGVVRGELLCAGGEVDQAALSTVESYNAVHDTWATRTMMPGATAGTQGAVIGNRLYVPGGSRTLNLQPESSLYVFSPLDTF